MNLYLGSAVPFNGYADQIPGLLPGNIIIILREKEHETFARRGNNLYMEFSISLSEALTGFRKIIEYTVHRLNCITVVYYNYTVDNWSHWTKEN